MTRIMTANELVQFASTFAEKVFRNCKEIRPMYHYIRENGDHAIFEAPTQLNKDQSVALVRDIFKAERAVAYVFISEAWMMDLRNQKERAQKVVDDLYRKYDSIENAPGRLEVIVMVAEDRNGGVIQGRREIHRPEDRDPYLGELQVDSQGVLEGRMVGLLTPTTTSH